MDIFGPVLHHRGQLPVLAVQELLPSLHILLTFLSLAPADPGPASASHATPAAPLPDLRLKTPPRLGRPDEQQEEEEDGDKAHGDRGGQLWVALGG